VGLHAVRRPRKPKESKVLGSCAHPAPTGRNCLFLSCPANTSLSRPVPFCPDLSRVRAPRAADGKAGSPGPSCQMAARRKDRRVTDRRRQRRRGDRPNARNRHQPLAHCVRPGLRRQPGVELPDPALGVAQLVEYPALRAIPNLAAVSTLTRSLRERSASRSRRRALTSRCRLPLGRQAQRRPGPPRPHAPAGSPGPRP
jgi:hypothetical protein